MSYEQKKDEIVDIDDDWFDCDNCPLKKKGQFCTDCPYEES